MTAWIPYADGELESAAMESVERVTEALTRDYSARMSSMSLWEGGAGLALALASLGRGRGNQTLVEVSEAVWADTIQELERRVVDPGLYTGFCGVGWVDALLGDGFDPGIGDSVHEELERVLLAHLERYHGMQHVVGYDLTSGLVGFGVYALEREGRGRSAQILSVIVEELLDRAVEQDVGCTWMNARPASQSDEPKHLDLGLAHGVPGVLALLARASGAGCLPVRGHEILEGGVECLLGSKRPMSNGLMYPCKLSPEGTPIGPGSCRVAWCYGDLGVAAALLMAGKCCERPSWSREALELALNCARVRFEESGVNDHGLCHGATGVAHTLARMSAVLGDDELRRGAQRWLWKALEMRVPSLGIAGFARMTPRNPQGRSAEERDYYLSPDRGFLMGAGGVALAMAAACSPDDPAWDRALLLSS